MADIIGLQLAYKAFTNYKKYASLFNHSTNNTKSSETDYTSIQRFFIHYAQESCETVRPEAAEKMLARQHAPNKFRVTGPLRNFEAFSEAFDCPVNSGMNPESKCRMTDDDDYDYV